AQNSSTPLESLRRILAESPPAVRARVIYNEACPRELIDEIARTDDSKEIRDALCNSNVALNPETVLWLYENAEKEPQEWARDDRFPVAELGRLLPKMQPSYHRHTMLHSNDYHLRYNARCNRPLPDPIPHEVLIKCLDFDDDKY